MASVEAEIILKLVLAAVLGAAIGYERELHAKPAGLRTHALVCMGSALFAIMSFSVPGVLDASRIAAGIVIGIGFLGGGMILQSKDKVFGLTTAAELWTLAAIGIAVGTGFFATAVAATILVLIILVPARRFEKRKK